jgi:hypothetical protein
VLKEAPTAALRHQMRKYYRQGYTMAIITKEKQLVPGYSDWVLEAVVDILDAKVQRATITDPRHPA